MKEIKEKEWILFQLDASTIQWFLEPNIKRKLTKKELNRIYYEFMENQDAQDHLYNFILDCAENVMDNSDGQWDWVDKEYKDMQAYVE